MYITKCTVLKFKLHDNSIENLYLHDGYLSAIFQSYKVL